MAVILESRWGIGLDVHLVSLSKFVEAYCKNTCLLVVKIRNSLKRRQISIGSNFKWIVTIVRVLKDL